MLIQCPQCERVGEIPDRFGLTSHRIRCRACQARFWTVAPGAKEVIDRHATPFERSPDTRIASPHTAFPFVPVSASLDHDDDSTLDGLDPDDSHYELTVRNEEEIDDSQVDIPAFMSGDDPSSDEIAVLVEDPPTAASFIAEPRHSQLNVPRGRFRFAGPVAVGALSLTILAFLVRQGILDSQTVNSSITALIAGCIGLGGVLLLLLSMSRTPLHQHLGELAKILRRPRPRRELDRPVASD
jgi:hypothetical protein